MSGVKREEGEGRKEGGCKGEGRWQEVCESDGLSASPLAHPACEGAIVAIVTSCRLWVAQSHA